MIGAGRFCFWLLNAPDRVGQVLLGLDMKKRQAPRALDLPNSPLFNPRLDKYDSP